MWILANSLTSKTILLVFVISKVGLYISLSGVLKASNKANPGNVLDSCFPTPQLGRKAKENSCRWPKHMEEKKKTSSVCMCVYTYTYKHILIRVHTHTPIHRHTIHTIHIHIHPLPSKSCCFFIPARNALPGSIPCSSNLGWLALGWLWGCDSHSLLVTVTLEASCDGTTFTGCSTCSLRKTVCSKRYIGLSRNISGVG